MTVEDTIRGLEIELAGYDRFGKSARAAEVKAELARLRGEKPAKETDEPAPAAKPRKKAAAKSED